MKKISQTSTTFLVSIILIAIVCIVMVSHGIVNHQKEDSEAVLMTASWSYHYSDLEELTKSSDLIARIAIDEAKSYTTSEGIPMTNYTATIDTAIYGCKENDTINIVMTGGRQDGVLYEIIDDPLMNIQDDFIIFARQNEDESYTILGGPQGRMSIKDELVSSLNMSSSQVRTDTVGSNTGIQNVPVADFFVEVQSFIDKGRQWEGQL